MGGKSSSDTEGSESASSKYIVKKKREKTETNLIIFHFSIVYIQLKTDRRTCGLDWQH